ncbi:TolB family protein, partial [Steroidobacter sp.]|uniref:TolB family protein n=1 Tax=Steroidobacter sp. TaxID=1978227 RepID=UPI001A54C0CC
MTLSECGRACLVAIIASSAGFALPIQAGDQQPAVTLAAAKEAVVSARSVLRRGFDSNRQRAIAWSADGNLWVASEPDFSPRILSARDQQGSITQIYPSGDGQSFFFVREQGSSPGTKELLQVAIDKAGSAKRVDSGADIPTQLSFAPSGDAVAFVDGTMLYEYRRIADGQWQRRALLDASDPRNTAAIGLSDIAYSADGSQLAWVSQRKAQQRYVAVHDIAKGETRYLDPGVFVDLSPVWSPDGSEVAFIRWPTNLVMNYRFSSGREGVPWSIVAANVKTGAARTVWKADAGPGSLPAGFDLIWAPSGEILFRWEKTGWNLLYAVPASGGAARLLTPGDGEVLSQPALSADGRSVVYSANIGDLMRPHLWSVALAGGAPK